MAEYANHARSGRFIKVYLVVWGLLAAGALGYMLMLAWQPDLLATPTATVRPQMAEADPNPEMWSKAMAEVGTIRRTVSDLQKDVGSLKVAVERHEEKEKVVESRVTELETKFTTLTIPAVSQAPAPKQKSAAVQQHKAVVVKGPNRDGPEPRAPTRIISVTEAPQTPPAESETPQGPIETGSIAPPDQPIVFGEAEVKPAHAPIYGVQLGAGPSLDALRLSWSLLLERHGPALAELQPRYVAPRGGSGPYRLVAGPLPSRSDANRVCTEMGVGRNGCFSTTFIGEPL